jgi:hypothetical protein
MALTLDKLTDETYISYLEQIHTDELSGKKKYIYILDGKYVLLDVFSPKITNNGAQRLSFRQICILGKGFKKSVEKNKNVNILSQSLKRMCLQKLVKEERRHLFIRLICLIYDYVRNYWDGYGLTSSTALALGLIEEWSKKIEASDMGSAPMLTSLQKTEESRENPAPITKNNLHLPASLPLNPEVNRQAIHNPKTIMSKKHELSHFAAAPTPRRYNKKNTDTQSLLSVKITKDLWEQKKDSPAFIPIRSPEIPEVKECLTLRTAKESYKANPTQCSESAKRLLFMDCDTKDKVLNLMNELTRKDPIDLTNPIGSQMILDVFKRCKKEVADELAQELSKQTVDLLFLARCFEVYIERENTGEGVNDITLYTLERLVKIYYNQYLNVPESAPVLPANHPSVVAVFRILLNKFHNCDDNILKFLSRLLEKPEFDVSVFISFISVFKDKLNNDPSVVYRARDRLYEYFQESPRLQEEYRNYKCSEEMKNYLMRLKTCYEGTHNISMRG